MCGNMGRCERAWQGAVGWGALLLTLGWLGWGVGVSLGQEAGRGSPLRLLFPFPRSVLEVSRFELIAVHQTQGRNSSPRLLVDGRPHPWEPYRAPVLVARLHLSPGKHRLEIGSQRVEVFVKGEKGPPPPQDWPLLRSHPSSEEGIGDCRLCHEVEEREGLKAILAVRTPGACEGCHSEEEFAAAHSHPKAPLAPCQICHTLHGSSQKGLLKKPARELCLPCHD